MNDLIRGIIIQKSNFPDSTPVEECEKKENGYIVRFQRPTNISLPEKIFQFFSDIRNGVTKAKDVLCNKPHLPETIHIKGHKLVIATQSTKGAEGVSTSYEKNWPEAFSKVDIFFKEQPEVSLNANPADNLSHAELGATQESVAFPPPPLTTEHLKNLEEFQSSQNLHTHSDLTNTIAIGKEATPVPPSTVNRPPLSTAQQPPIGRQAPPLPSIEGRRILPPVAMLASVPTQESTTFAPQPPIAAEQLNTYEENHTPQNQRPQRTAPPDVNQPAFPPGYQPSASPPPPAVGGLQLHDQIRQGVVLKKTEISVTQSKVENTTEPTIFDQIKQGIPLRKAEVNTKQKFEIDEPSHPLFDKDLQKKMDGIRNANKDNDNKEDEDEWN